MKIVVLKFGGSSVGTIQKIKKVAEIITDYKKKKYKVIVVQKTHQNRYEFVCETPHGTLRHKFSSIREFSESSGLRLEKQLRKLLY